MFRMISGTCCCLLILGATSCSKDKDYAKNPVKPKPHVVKWDVPRPYNPQYEEPLRVNLSPDGRHLMCSYFMPGEPNDWGISIVDLTTEGSRWISSPCGIVARGLSEDMLAIFTGGSKEGEDCTGYFLEIDSLTRIGPSIPIGAPVPSQVSDYVAVVAKNETAKGDIWLFDTVSKTEMILPASRHGLLGFKGMTSSALADNYLVISGETAGPDDAFESTKTQLWRLPELEKIFEYETSEWIPRRSSSHYPQLLGKELFCFSPYVGVVRVGRLDTGKIRYSLGHALTEAEWSERLERDTGEPMQVVADPCCTQESGLLVCIENFKSARRAEIKTYDVNSGKCVNTLPVPFENLLFVLPAKVGKEWVILCGWFDPKEFEYDSDSIRPHKVWIVPYRLRDMAKAASIEAWRGFLHDPLVVDGKLIFVMTDHVNIIDLSTIVKF